MYFGKYQFLCRLTNEARLPYFKGSTFRGVFGRALKNVVCALKTLECSECLLKKRCLYSIVFEMPLSSGTPEGPRVAAAPHPFVIEPLLDTRTHFPKGAAFDFHLILFGEANRNLPYFIYALEQMGRIGIGMKVNGKRGKFNLEEVRAGGQPIYSCVDQKLTLEDPFEAILLQDPGDSSEDCFKLTVRMITPLRLKFENRLKAELPFHILARAMLRRVSSLYNYFGEGEPSLDYRGLVNRAKAVQIIEDNLRWYDWERYSFRQDQAMLMGGLVGSVTYEGKIGEYMPLIDFCSRAHLGKQTSFGLGQIKWEKVG